MTGQPQPQETIAVCGVFVMPCFESSAGQEVQDIMSRINDATQRGDDKALQALLKKMERV